MEDAGRSFLEYTARSEQEALDWIDAEVKRSNGWYSKGSFIITKAQHDF